MIPTTNLDLFAGVRVAGYAELTLFVADFDALVAPIDERRLDPVKRETYDNGVRQFTYRDPDGKEIGFGGAPL